MESAAVLRPFNCTASHMRISPEGPCAISVYSSAQRISSNSCNQGIAVGGKLVLSQPTRKQIQVSCVKTPGAALTAKADDSSSKGSLEKNSVSLATFPNGFEALVLDVCDETQIAELKLKVGDFEMHMKRNVGATKAPASAISPTTPPPIPSEPMAETAASVTPSLAPPNSASNKVTPFKNGSRLKPSKLAALEASGSNTYVLVSSPTVGSFRRGRTLKGKKQAPICKEGDLVKEGQVIGYLEQFGTELPVKSDASGEVLKLLFNDGEAVGYGDPLVAILPSFHGIK